MRTNYSVRYACDKPEDVIVQRGIVEENMNFIGKPYNLQQLAAKLREVLTEN